MRKILLALVMVAALPVAAQADPVRPDVCGKLKEVAFNNSVLCTHGPDPKPTPGATAIANAMFENPGAPAPCVKTASETNYTSGSRIRVLYGVPSDRTPSASNKALIPGWLGQASDKLRSEGGMVNGSYVGQNFRFYCTGSPAVVDVTSVTLDPVGADNSYSFDDLLNSLERLGHTDRAYDYAVFVDQLNGVYPHGGQGSIRQDSDPDPAANTNNDATISKVSLITVNPSGDYSPFVFLHEVGHNLGAVQYDAPHTSNGWHCTDEYDVMCYSDSPNYPDMTYVCDSTSGESSLGEVWDCGKDDYYNVEQAAINASGSYLESHWNLARSSWFSPVPGLTSSGAPVVTAPTFTFGTGAINPTTKAIPVVISWSATDPQGISSYRLQMQTDGGAWTNVSLTTPTSKSVTRQLVPGHTYDFQVRATDGGGTTSDWVSDDPFGLGAIQEREGRVVFTGTWKEATSSNYMKSITTYTTARNASAYLSFEGLAVAWVGTKGSIYGSSIVSVDGGAAITKSQKASTMKYRNILHKAAWPEMGTHNIRVTCLATSGSPRCDVDAFVVMLPA